jgi:serine/threonine protein kinase
MCHYRDLGNVVVQELRGRRKEKALLVGMSFGSAASLVSSPSAATKASAQRYKAPEVTKGGAPTKASDIYGFGKTIRVRTLAVTPIATLQILISFIFYL